MKLLILQICPNLSGGGAELIARKLSELIKGSEIESYGIFFKNKTNQKLFKNQIVLGDLSTKNLIIYFRLLKKIVQISKGYSNVILHGHLSLSLYYLIPFSFFKKYTLLYTEHSPTNNRRKLLLLKPLEKFIYSRYKKVFSISPFVQKELLNWLDIKISISPDLKKFNVIFNGFVGQKFIQRKLKKEKYNVISIGGLNQRKGFDVTIKSMKFCKEFIDTYYILGTGPEKHKLEKIINDENLNHIVKLVGFKEDIFEYLEKTDIGLIPSRYEGFGLVSLEMLSSGLPLCISNVGGMSDILKDFKTVKIIDGYNEKKWANEIIKSLNSLPNKSEEIYSSLNQSSKYSLENMIQNYKNEYIKFS
tara:strand:+ start:7929 stop:9011 length:1083 start_codon:yes stop_codon:yes gene_type:complete